MSKTPGGLTANAKESSALLDRYQAEGNVKALAVFKKISPVAWQHIHFPGHQIFCDRRDSIDVQALRANLFLL